MYQMAVQQINANLPAAKAKRRRRPQCDPAVADTYRYIWAMQDAIKAVDMQALAKPDAEYADGLATGYWLARNALHKGGNLVARLRAALDRKHKDTTDRLDRGLVIDFDECVAGSMIDELRERYGFEVQSHLLEFYGVCEKCKEGPGHR